MQSFFNFLKYNNTIPIVLSVIVLGAGATFAVSPELRQSVFSEVSQTDSVIPSAPKKIDSSKLLSQDIDNFDLHLRIDSINEDAEAYFVAYSYQTLEVLGEEWQVIQKNAKMDIPKALLGNRELQTYLVEQLGQVMHREVAYLTEVQETIRVKSNTKKSGEYASLVGQEIDKSVVEKEKNNAEKDIKTSTDQTEEVAQKEENVPSRMGISEDELNKMIMSAVAKYLEIDTSMPDMSQIPTATVEGEGSSEDFPVIQEDVNSPVSLENGGLVESE